MKLTKQQIVALDKLRAMQPFAVITSPRSGNLIIETGINTQTLHSLRDMGLIKCEMLWLRGVVSPDLEIIK